jgi:hypothetical protein
MIEVILIGALIAVLCIFGTVMNSIRVAVVILIVWAYVIYLSGWQVFFLSFTLTIALYVSFTFCYQYLRNKSLGHKIKVWAKQFLVRN